MPNPFDKKPPKKKPAGAAAFKKKAKPYRPDDYAERMAEGKAKLEGIAVGDAIRVTWQYDDEQTVHEGIVVELDDWLRCKPFSTSNGKFNVPVAGLRHVSKIERA